MDPQSNVGLNAKKTSTGSALREGELTKSVEQITAKVPSMGYLGIALGSMAISAGLAFFTNRKGLANFVGLWAPTILIMGLYNKLVKLEGSDRAEHLH